MISFRAGIAAATFSTVAAVWLAGAERATAPAYVFTAARQYDAQAWLDSGERFPAGASLILVSGGKRRPLAPGFHASADAAVSFDGTNILFSARPKAADKWQIWEAAVSGGAPRLIAASEGNCIRPLYLPDGRIVFTRLFARSTDVQIVAAPGGKAEHLTHSTGQYLTSDVLRDGRILMEVAQPGRIRELFTVYPDGTGFESIRCDHGPDRSDARQLASGDVVFHTGGRLARFTSALAGQTELTHQPPGEVAGPVAELSAGKWLVASRGKTQGNAGLFLWDAKSGTATPLETPANANALQPAVVTPRIPPREFPSALVESRTTGNLLCLNARESKTPIPADVRTVRIYSKRAGNPILLGEAPVERDGSFYVEVPADRPLRIELLDAAGKAVRAEKGWFWMRPSEQRICVGCHTGPERSPENKVPDVLLRTTVPVKTLGEAGS
jgi:hypothetical protein